MRDRSENEERDVPPEAEAYHRPPEVPREAMWAEIEAAITRGPGQTEPFTPLRGGVRGPADGRPFGRWRSSGPPTGSSLAAGVAAAALLVIGIGIGRLTVKLPVPDPVPPSEHLAAELDERSPYAYAAARYLADAESFLSLLRSDARAGRMEMDASRRAETLLLETRLLMDAPAAENLAIRDLLDDLELILVQVARLEGAGGNDSERQRAELGIIQAGMDAQDVLPRIQAALPWGRNRAGEQ